MKSAYIVIIDLEEREHFNNAVRGTNIKYTVLGDAYNVIKYRVSLSKYELLYLRLACKVGKIKAVNCKTTKVDVE